MLRDGEEVRSSWRGSGGMVVQRTVRDGVGRQVYWIRECRSERSRRDHGGQAVAVLRTCRKMRSDWQHGLALVSTARRDITSAM